MRAHARLCFVCVHVAVLFKAGVFGDGLGRGGLSSRPRAPRAGLPAAAGAVQGVGLEGGPAGGGAAEGGVAGAGPGARGRADQPQSEHASWQRPGAHVSALAALAAPGARALTTPHAWMSDLPPVSHARAAARSTAWLGAARRHGE